MKRTDLLTPRQREILQLIASERLSSKEAAPRVGIGWRRVDDICSEAARRMGVASRREAVRIALEELGSDPPGDLVGAPSGVPGPTLGEAETTGLEDNPVAVAYPPTAEPTAASPAQHAERRLPLGPDLGRPGTGAGRDRLYGEQALGGRFRDGALGGEFRPQGGRALSAGVAHPGEHSEGGDPARRPGVLSWIGGRARFSELSPLVQVWAIFVVAALIAVTASPIVYYSSQLIEHLQPLVGGRLRKS